MTAAELAQAHWNSFPLSYSEEERYRVYPWLARAAEFAEHSGELILEVGCGSGCDLLQFAKYGAIAHGIDICEEHLRLAKQRVAGAAEVNYGDGRDIPYSDESFDYVYSHGVLHHCDEPAKVVSEILRVLKSRGRFNIQVYSKWSYFPLYLMLRFGKRWRLFVENSRLPVHVELYSARSLKELFPVSVTIIKRHGGI